jgi:hypothetical protein
VVAERERVFRLIDCRCLSFEGGRAGRFMKRTAPRCTEVRDLMSGTFGASPSTGNSSSIIFWLSGLMSFAPARERKDRARLERTQPKVNPSFKNSNTACWLGAHTTASLTTTCPESLHRASRLDFICCALCIVEAVSECRIIHSRIGDFKSGNS